MIRGKITLAAFAAMVLVTGAAANVDGGVDTGSPTGDSSIAISASGGVSPAAATASGDYSIAEGAGASATEYKSIAIGTFANSAGSDGIAIGGSSSVISANGIGIGSATNIQGIAAIGIGNFAGAIGDYSIAEGAGAMSFGNYSVAIGSQSRADSPYEFSVGDASQLIFRRISNVATPILYSDAATKGYVDNAIDTIASSGGGVDAAQMWTIANSAASGTYAYADYKAEETLNASKSYTDEIAAGLKKEIYQSTALSAALAASPVIEPGKSSALSVSNGFYKGYSAVAVTFAKRIGSSTTFTGGFSANASNVASRTSINFSW